LTAEYDALAESDEGADLERFAQVEQRIDELTTSAEGWSADTLGTLPDGRPKRIDRFDPGSLPKAVNNIARVATGFLAFVDLLFQPVQR